MKKTRNFKGSGDCTVQMLQLDDNVTIELY